MASIKQWKMPNGTVYDIKATYDSAGRTISSAYVQKTGDTMTGDLTIYAANPTMVLRANADGTNTYSILRFGNTSSSDGAAYIWLNGPSRTSDGGVNTMSIRNNVGNLRIDNNTTVTGTLTTNKCIYSTTTASTDLTVIPTATQVALSTGDGSGSQSAWIWRENYAPSNWGIFHNNNNDYIHIVGNNIARFTVRLGGNNVGVNNSTPSYNLDINGNTHVSDYLYTNNRITVGASMGQQNGNRAEFHLVSSANTPCDLWMGTGSTDRWSINCRASDENYRFSLYNTNVGHLIGITWGGLVGIGTSSPGYKLQVAGTGYFSNTVRLARGDGNYCEGIRMYAEDSTWQTLIMGCTGETGTNTYAWSLHRKSNNDFCISRASSDGANGLVLTTGGYCGIGTASPGYKLQVNGTIMSYGGQPGFYSYCSAGNWSYLRLNSDGRLWDIAVNTNSHNGALEFRYGGSDTACYVTAGTEVLYGACWNDYAEYRTSQITEPGRCIIEVGDDTLILSTERLQKGAEIVSDTFGFAIGQTDDCQTPIAASGRVLAYGFEDREVFKSHIGDPVCSGPNGTVSLMTPEEEERYPSRIIGTVSAVPDYEIWGTGKVEVKGRIWIRIR